MAILTTNIAGGGGGGDTFLLSTLPLGMPISFSVNGVSRVFLVVHQGSPSSMYDESFNDGTILLMQDIYEGRQWHSSSVSDYANSTIHSYLNNEFLNLIDPKIKAQIKQVKIPYRPGSSGSTVKSGANGLPAYVWLLGGYEVNVTSATHAYLPVDGATLGYFSGMTSTDVRRIGFLNGTATNWWLRSPYTNAATHAWVVSSSGVISVTNCVNSNGVRAALVLPNTVKISTTYDSNGAFPIVV